MDIGQISMAMARTELLTDVGTTLMAKSLDTSEAAGDGLVKMMEQSVNPAVGGNIDISV